MIKRSAIITLEVVAAFIVLVLLVVGAAAWRLSQGPVSVTALTPYVVEALTEDGTFDLEVKDTILAWAGWNR